MSSVAPDGGTHHSSSKRASSPYGRAPTASTLPPKPTSPLSTSRQNAVTPLAPLEYLQNQRRGSITDPSLHAASTPSFPPGPAGSSSVASPFRRPESPPPSFPSSASHEPRRSFSQSRPLSPYRFGDASTHSSGSPSAHFRRLLRSPTPEPGDRRAMAVDTNSREVGPGERNGSQAPDRAKGGDHMEVDKHENPQQHGQERGGHARPDHGPRDMEDIHYSGRRQSVVAGTKRKMSSDKGVYPRSPDIDPQLVGPEGGREDEPAPKRRGSAIDTARIAQLSLYDRRNSVDARASAGSPWWTTDRRDSTSSASAYTGNSNTPLTTGYTTPSSALPGDSPHGRPPGGIATFAWPANPPASDQPPPTNMQHEPAVNMPGPHSFDPLTTAMPPVAFAPDRRMSAPNISSDALPPASGPSRALRSRSRPPSRASPGESNPEDGGMSDKPSGSTPYSRSPELRVSHKLAERKRRKEMKELFDELRDQLPADRGMKASKWEILSKAIDFIVTLKQSHQDMGNQIEMLRHEVEGYRQGMPPPFAGAPPHSVVHGYPVGEPPQARLPHLPLITPTPLGLMLEARSRAQDQALHTTRTRQEAPLLPNLPS
ncbi:uncharacterized protein BXZ73DRAFT_97454 [Epithele typhae]|uniref:uncharacterized protein n=1 Tax=Epithele typhae TaxID=378194 RepID=UPI002007B06E|nr:uncharacterized protein BXZ73DRAFT_97454 [Epithele typhae]KAH9943413.1 hypothetical protein BXZ73DRAFT_97454 [Epithele typhae]